MAHHATRGHVDSATAKCEYGLTDTDLKALFSWQERDGARVYRLEDVKITQLRKESLRNIAQVAEQWYDGTELSDHAKALAWLYGPSQLVSRKMDEAAARMLFDRFVAFEAAISDMPYVSGTIAARDAYCHLLDEGALEGLLIRCRAEKLAIALRKRGLCLRRDSHTCAQYVYGRRDDLDEVVDIMQEMEWLMRNTEYADVMHSRVEDRRQQLFVDKDVWLPQRQYEEYIRRNINFVDLSEDSKRIAVTAWLMSNDPTGLYPRLRRFTMGGAALPPHPPSDKRINDKRINESPSDMAVKCINDALPINDYQHQPVSWLP
jgi:hypothetical protein